MTTRVRGKEEPPRENRGFAIRESEARVRAANDGRCTLCKGDTEHPWSRGDGRICSIPKAEGECLEAWLCESCRFKLGLDRSGQARSVQDTIKAFSLNVDVRYTRPESSTGYRFGKTFQQLNARQREGIINELDWIRAQKLQPDLEAVNPGEFARLRARYESTKANGRHRRKRPGRNAMSSVNG